MYNKSSDKYLYYKGGVYPAKGSAQDQQKTSRRQIKTGLINFLTQPVSLY